MLPTDIDLPELERPPETVYRGQRDGKCIATALEHGEYHVQYEPQVYVSEPGSHYEFPLLPRRELSNSAPQANFQWGYTGHGPYLLAVSLVADAYGDDNAALAYQTPVEELLDGFDQHDDWELLAKDLDAFIEEHE